MSADVSLGESLESERLARFIADLESRGFRHVGDRRWEGPVPRSLVDAGHTTSKAMTIVIRPLWPYTSPLLEVPGISAWHADNERLCLWRDDDTSQEWSTVDGLLGRIDTWVAHASDAFEDVENARNPDLYWQAEMPAITGLVDIEELIGSAGQDGQHGEFGFAEAVSADGQASPGEVLDITPGAFGPRSKLPFDATDWREFRGRWFYRDQVERPPRDLEELRGFLTDNQRIRLDRDLRDRPWLMYGLVWRNAAGLVCTMVLRLGVAHPSGDHVLITLKPKGLQAMLLRAGPDAGILQTKSVAIIGVGAIGSNVASILARSGLGRLVLVDYDRSWPVNLIRHAAPPGTPAGELKTVAMKRHLEQYPWINVEIPWEHGIVYDLGQIGDLVDGVDLTIDATGHGGFAEVMARVAAERRRPYLSAALFQGGGIARVRRQVLPTDTALVLRPHVDGYPHIPPLAEEIEYAGTETGCLAQVHNAPPVAVVVAASLATEAAVDVLTERYHHPDEIIEVLRPSDAPFGQLGRVRPSDLPRTIDLTEAAAESVGRAAHAALPNETGGVLLGCTVDGRVVVTAAIEIADPEAGPDGYYVPPGAAEAAVQAHATDPRVGYVGDWHSHPDGSPPSPRDRATMMALQETSGSSSPLLLLVTPGGSRSQFSAHVASADRLVSAEIVFTGDLGSLVPAEAEPGSGETRLSVGASNPPKGNESNG